MMASLYSGVSGLKNHQVRLNVIGNNIANINTIGYKSSRVTFQEALVQTFRGAGRPSSVTGGTNPVQLGLGMQVAAIDTLFKQGGMETTGQITDMAIQGAGFFILGDGNDNRFYTRAGALGFDSNSAMVDPGSGLYLMGKMADATGQIPSQATLGNITLPFGQQDPANPTTNVTLSNNLDASATDSTASLVQAGSSSVQTASGTAFDGVGGVHTISITGNQAVNSSFVGGAGAPGVTPGTLLSSLGVTIFDDFTISIDGGSAVNITGMNALSTIEDLLNAINQVEGITAELFDVGAGVLKVKITRDKAGDPAVFSFKSSAASDDGVDANIVASVFGIADTGTPATDVFTSANGAASTYIAVNSFAPDQGSGAAAGPILTNLGLYIDEYTGLVTGLTGIGGAGVEVTTGSSGLTATTAGNELVIQTEPTTHTMSMNVFDSQGGKHTLSIEFFKSVVDNRWEWTVAMIGNETVTAGGTGNVSFYPDGSIHSFNYDGGATAVTIDPNNGAANMTITLDAGTTGNYDGLTGFSSGSHTASIISQNGYGMGILEKMAIDQTGFIAGIFSNGVTRMLAQILLADFSNESGLRKAGRSMYQPTANSGEALVGVAGETVSATIFSGALESSSVDIAEEFTSMITTQRGFQANARIISTSDNMLDELVNIKR